MMSRLCPRPRPCPRPRLLIIGNGMACNRLLARLQQEVPEKFHITVIGQESCAAYNRVLLTPWLNDEFSREELRLQPADWYQRQGIALHLGDAAVAIDAQAKTVRCASGTLFGWDLLVLATGAQAVMPKLPGHDLEGVMCLRTLHDAERLRARSADQRRMVVIGGGVLGLEAAWALNEMGAEVALVHREAWLMNRQLDEDSGRQLTEAVRARGIEVHTGVQCTRFVADLAQPAKLAALELSVLSASAADDCIQPRRIACDTAVLAIGIQPDIALAQTAGVHCERAIVVDRCMRSSLPGIFALGECCQIGEELFGLVAPVYQQADVLASLLAGWSSGSRSPDEAAAVQYQSRTLGTRLKVAGLDVYSVGQIPARPQRSLTWRNQAQGQYRRLWLQDRQVVAAVGVGDLSGLESLADESQAHPSALPALLLGGAQAA